MPTPTEDDATTPTSAEILAVHDGTDGWGVITAAAPASAYQTSPCARCPWLRDSPVGAFPPEVFRHSARTTYDLATHKFGCHASTPAQPKTCAGFLLRGAAHNLSVRVHGPDVTAAVSTDRPLYDNYREMAIANGVAPGDPSLAPCRDSLADLEDAPLPGTTPGPQADLALARATRIIRDFIVASVGADHGGEMTSQAQLLAGRLAAHGHLATGSTTPQAAETATAVIRAFIVDSVGEDTGDDMTEQAKQLRHHLTGAGLLADGVYEPIPLSRVTSTD
ncbi:hypothetical protein Amsp01_090360 [Amycolatopsis sp. NBRC 101858]|uniref:DUF6283 family protein n=1 Tax=Amycolatopsis sp. NBRC 101858 TaxID=3032200 RepID=UPI0024A309D0|nr:DUF6283 family protein [Amycolatopsis sp. NBRC 101858]GLY43013.1 hypothetical protein Amsp01_090360 [Amycolatopsis sp. NBRC 101858]